MAGFAPHVAAARRREEGLEAPPIRPRVLETHAPETVPLSFAQQRLWFIDRFEPGAAFYNIPAALRLAGPLDPGALARALGEIVRRHEVLRTRFETRDGVPVQVIDPVPDPLLAICDLGGLPEPVRRAAADQLARREARRPFDLARGPMLRAVLMPLGRDRHVLLVTVHHVAFDGWSLGVFLRQLKALYQGLPLPELEVQYA
ncbi:MAG: non-ribosomal peptide synthetase, partial [Deltaproteobacteria bacterium]|nr:non-ribosomal peptide synthetase [Deltaproteobacteria bacterium]